MIFALTWLSVKNILFMLLEPPSVPPEIRGVPADGVSRGDWLKVQCHLPWMNVKPQLEFYVNGRHASHMVSYLSDSTRHVLKTLFVPALWYSEHF